MFDYIGLAFLGFSLIQKDLLKLRIYGIICCGYYVVYGLTADIMPLVWPNLFITICHCYAIIKEKLSV